MTDNEYQSMKAKLDELRKRLDDIERKNEEA
jgi:tetrahydromethanopterin S-methyltransferase subunit G